MNFLLGWPFFRAKWQNVSFREGMMGTFIRILVFTNHDFVGAVCYLISPKNWINPQLLGYLLTRANLWERIPLQVPEWITIQPVLAMIASWKDISHYPRHPTELFLPKYLLNVCFFLANFELFNIDMEPQFPLAGSLSAIDPWSSKTPRHTWLSIANDKIHPHFGHSAMSHLWLLFARLAWTPYK